jgi:DNA-nicking Smr family endonuclease
MARDVDLFAKAMADVKPLRGKKAAKAEAVPAVTPRLKAEEPSKPKERSLVPLGMTKVAKPPPDPDLVADPRSFDREVDRALSRGKLTPDATLDLHGMTLATAERAVARFLEQAIAQDWKVALVVTGKGLRREDGRVPNGRQGGRIRAEFVGWLNRAENRARVHGVRPAHPRHGGTGAFYVLLRRRSASSKRSLRATPQR